MVILFLKIDMKKRILILWCLLFSAFFSVSGQNLSDSLLVVGKEWKTVKIAKGVIWKQGHFVNLFDSEQEINFVEVDLKKRSKRVRLAGDEKVLKTTRRFAEENNALVAINGGFFDMKNGGSVDHIKIEGKLVNPTRTASNRANSILSIHNKHITIQKASLDNTVGSAADNVMLSGPLLVLEGNRVNLENNPFNSNRHPRTAIAINRGNKLILMVVDGRNSQANGMSLIELSKVLQWIGAKDAMNLDGGGSSTLYISGYNVVNYPSDNKLFDHEGQRPVANIIYVKK